MTASISVAVHIKLDESEFKIVTRQYDGVDYVRLHLDTGAVVFMSPMQLLILRDQINAWTETGQ